MQNVPPTESSRYITKAGATSIALLILTALHHFYGGMVFGSAFRLHVAMFSVAATLALLAALLLHRSARKSIFGSILFWSLALFVAVPAGLVGMAEGGYDHVLRDILYFSNASSQLMLKLFPSSYGFAPPRNAPFEITGALQFFVGLLAFYYLFPSLRSRLAPRVRKPIGSMP
jgi:hypothetical protein